MIESKRVDVECFCGKVKGVLKIVKKDLFHAQCLCCDCQSYAENLENADKILDSFGASSLVQTYPKYLAFLEGRQFITCGKLSNKGLLRWYASCCNAPLANTMPSPNVPFIGVSTKVLKFASDEEKARLLGPITVKAFAKYAKGQKPKDAYNKFPMSYMFSIAVFMLKGKLLAKTKPHPFFKSQRPIAEPILLG